MKLLVKATIGAGMLALAACGGSGDDAAGEQVQENYENRAEVLDEAADNATGAQADMLENRSEAMSEKGEAMEEAIDEADVQVNQ